MQFAIRLSHLSFVKSNPAPTETPVTVMVEPTVKKDDVFEHSAKKVSFNETVTQHVIEPVSVEIGK